jgi:hypothetical protein
MSEHADMLAYARQLIAENPRLAKPKPPKRRSLMSGTKRLSKAAMPAIRRYELQTVPVAFKIPRLYHEILRAKGRELAEMNGLVNPQIGMAIVAAVQEAGWHRQYEIVVERTQEELDELEKRRQAAARAREARKNKRLNAVTTTNE